jgi:large subunit ribosomal protein L6
MSRIGKKIIALPKGVEVKIDSLRNIVVKGPNAPAEGLFVRPALPLGLSVKVDGENLIVECETEEMGPKHGLFRSLIQNAVDGVTKGFEKRLELQGVGYKAEMKGNKLDLKLGFSHPLLLDVPAGLKTTVDKSQVLIIINGYDKQQVGKFAAEVRGYKPPEPYKGKGIRYAGEVVRRKEGKAAKGKA